MKHRVPGVSDRIMKENALLKQVAIEAALTAGRLLKKGLTKRISVSYKGRINLVTEMDLLAEEVIVSHIRRHFKDHQILAEEGHNQNNPSSYRWMIDPLDGTTNYAHRFPYFCVSIAVEFKKRILIGVIYDPVHQELFFAQKGKGAFLNDKPIRVSSVKTLQEALLVTGFAYNLRSHSQNNVDLFRRFLMKAQGVRRMGSAALDLCHVAAGRLDGFWESHLNPWDTAAGFLILQEAGGRVTRFSGAPFFVECPDILATNGKIHREMLKVLSESAL